MNLLSFQSSRWLPICAMPEQAPGLGTTARSSVWRATLWVCSYASRLRIPDGHTKILCSLEGVRARISRGWSGICAWLDADIYQPVIATDFGPVENVAVEMVYQ